VQFSGVLSEALGVDPADWGYDKVDAGEAPCLILQQLLEQLATLSSWSAGGLLRATLELRPTTSQPAFVEPHFSQAFMFQEIPSQNFSPMSLYNIGCRLPANPVCCHGAGQ
jgi:hypothetical protein